ncbi:DgyrCDS5985 [Dimorphilus gyrociliatus]|uniref:Eukaryotic translation initiation factor 2 subunit 2 n=1 Tax=Dimorphilus gyrociliatus TaxID=2664684 RepID=A0A7I8VP00_9ANNE|nr:DgyrCDS5985 [Dimorphilus gyrociliatus]
MEEEEPVFDSSMKKKKKKKPADLAPTKECDNSENRIEQTKKVVETLGEVGNKLNDFDINEDFLGKKKKKKKPITDSRLQDQSENNRDESSEKIDDEFSFDKKKKKRKGRPIEIDQVDGLQVNQNADTKISIDYNREYTYEELLQRVFDIMKEKNPDMIAGEKKRFVMKPPQVMRVGTKKSSFSNFYEICKMLHRVPKHLMAFLLAELGTSGAIDGNNQLIIKGRFQQKQIESVLRRYIKEYVTCHTCKSPDTLLSKDTRLYFLQCESCGSRCSVASIKSGFQAVTGKRAAIRAKTT